MRASAKGKAATAYRTISEVADELGVQQHVLRFWETRFSQIRPVKRGGGRRYYRPEDIAVLRRIRTLLYDDGYTIKGAQSVLKAERSGRTTGISGTAPSDAFPDDVLSDDEFSADARDGTDDDDGDGDDGTPDEGDASESDHAPDEAPSEGDGAMIPREPLMALLHELRWLRAGINLKR